MRTQSPQFWRASALSVLPAGKDKKVGCVRPGRAGDRDTGLSGAVDVAVDGDVASGQGRESPGPSTRIGDDSGSLQGRGELDEPCAGIVVGRDDGFIERNSVRAWVGHQRLHRGGVAIHRHRRVGDGDHRAAIESNGGNGDRWRRITARANRAARDRQLVRRRQQRRWPIKRGWPPWRVVCSDVLLAAALSSER